MKRRVEFLVRKRGGHDEWLRATKLCRSVQCALSAVGEHWPGRCLELASRALGRLRCRVGGSAPIQSDELAAVVEQVLLDSGHPEAAGCYAETRAERRRRELLMCRPAVLGGDRRAGFEDGAPQRPAIPPFGAPRRPATPPFGAAPDRFTP